MAAKALLPCLQPPPSSSYYQRQHCHPLLHLSTLPIPTTTISTSSLPLLLLPKPPLLHALSSPSSVLEEVLHDEDEEEEEGEESEPESDGEEEREDGPESESEEGGPKGRAPLVAPSVSPPRLTTKEKKELVSYARNLGKELKFQQVGKSGVTPSLVAAFVDILEANELLKIKVHGTCPVEFANVIKHLEQATGSVALGQVGRTVILYRPSLSKMKKKEDKEARARKVWKRRPRSPLISSRTQEKGRTGRSSSRTRRSSTSSTRSSTSSRRRSR